MAALQQPVGGFPAPQRSFADALQSSPSLPPLPPSFHPAVSSSEHGTIGTHKGYPSIEFSDSNMTDLSQNFSWVLIGKFTQGYNKKDPKLGRPSVEDLQKIFVAMDFKGSFQLGLLDNRHLLIQFQLEEDYLRLYSRMVWYVRGVSMRIFKWSPYFRVDKESSIVPIWITFPRLPIQFFQRTALYPIARLIGHPLRMDDSTAKLKRPSVARIQVEVDVLRDRPDKIWIQMGSKEGYWQSVEYENIPPYCCHCWHIGHEEKFCHVQHPDLKAQHAKASQPEAPKKLKQVYVPISKPVNLVVPNLNQSEDLQHPVVNISATIIPPVVIPTQNPILPAATLPSVDQPSSVVHLKSLTETPNHDRVQITEEDELLVLEAPPIQPDSIGACDSVVQTCNLSPRVAITKSPMEISPENNNGVHKKLLEPPEKNTTDSLVPDNGKACSLLPNEMGQNVTKMKVTLDNHSGEGSSKNSDKFSDAELRLLDDVQYFDPRTGTYNFAQLEDENLVDVPTTIEEDDNDSFQLVKPKKRGRPRKNKDRD